MGREQMNRWIAEHVLVYLSNSPQLELDKVKMLIAEVAIFLEEAHSVTLDWGVQSGTGKRISQFLESIATALRVDRK